MSILPIRFAFVIFVLSVCLLVRVYSVSMPLLGLAATQSLGKARHPQHPNETNRVSELTTRTDTK